jgi:hypothetical protein
MERHRNQQQVGFFEGGPDCARKGLPQRLRGRTNALVLEQVNQPAECVFIFAKSDGAVETRRAFLTMNADLPFLRVRNQLVATPGADWALQRMDGRQALRADRQNGNVG